MPRYKKGEGYWLGKHPSKEARERMSKAQKGKRLLSGNPNWRGGRIVIQGYIYICQPHHPLASNGYVAEHRLIMEKHLGRYLTRKEIIHHLNGNRSDNRIENLKLFPNSSKHLKQIHIDEIICPFCKKKFPK